jgi:hypothetical protein
MTGKEQRYETSVGSDEKGYYFGDGESRFHLSQAEMGALIMAQVHGQDIADAFYNVCMATLDSGVIPSSFIQDLSPKSIDEVREDLEEFRANFKRAMLTLMYLFEF